LFSAAPSHSIPSLHEAARDGNLDVLKQYIDNGMDINMKDEAGESPLWLATQHGRISVMRYLLERGAEVGYRLLVIALSQAYVRHNLEIVDTLLTIGWDKYFYSAGDWEYGNTLFLAVYAGHKKLVQTLLAHRVDMEIRNTSEATPLLEAAMLGHHDIVAILIDAGARSVFDHIDITPMTAAAKHNQPQVITVLLQKSFDINARDGGRETALTRAVASGHTQLVEMLLAKGADMRVLNSHGENSLMTAAKCGHRDLTALFIAKGFAVNEAGAGGKTALMYAAGPYPPSKSASQCKAIMTLLIANGADLNVQDHHGSTAFICAAEWGEKAVSEYLLSMGAEVNASTNDGTTALKRVLTQSIRRSPGVKALAKLLLHAGANLYAVDDKGKTTVDYAEHNSDWQKWLIHEYAWLRRRHAICFFEYKHRFVHKFAAVMDLIKAGNTLEAIAAIKLCASLCKHQEQATGNTLLHFTALAGNLVIIQALIHQGIDSSLKNKAGQSAIDLVAEPAKPFMQALLRERASFALDYEQLVL